MYALEIAGTLLFLSFIISFFFFLSLVVHSLIEERRREPTRQADTPSAAVSHGRQPAKAVGG